ncbi:n(G),N(G)-dimethylarginine dimethylaminohydrolase 1 domain protein [Dictyocaulus viviparus]|uniref:N(G),N(G)-dimethylarginine dimethylaminohydrolase 1 domain protein n=1 Tax=Dictyocaulus viviparus TaxID=29172 RepID=A0A0D8XN81_DICVI|nr:n(G),N(G)-dimethylarginine dimethylaminohydrolase 1 domain protein [Dictyocaulus viviparus]
MTFSHAVVVTVPKTLTYFDTTIYDTNALRKQSEGIIETLRGAGLIVSEYCPEDGASASTLLIGDSAISIFPYNQLQLRYLLSPYSTNIQECPDNVDGKTVVLNGGDVFFTGKEIFVGIRKHGTNFEGAKIVARVFCDHAVIPIHMSDKAQCLKYYVAIVAPGILAIGSSTEGQHILKILEAQSALPYKVIIIDDCEGINCMAVNQRLIFSRSKMASKLINIQLNNLEFWSVEIPDLLKFGLPLSRHCLLIKSKNMTKKNM